MQALKSSEICNQLIAEMTFSSGKERINGTYRYIDYLARLPDETVVSVKS
jgi:hypothetical protein